MHLMNQPWRNVHTFALKQIELADGVGVDRLFQPDSQSASAQVKRFALQFVEVQRAALAFPYLEDLAAVLWVVRNPHFATPTLRLDMFRGARASSLRVDFGYLRWVLHRWLREKLVSNDFRWALLKGLTTLRQRLVTNSRLVWCRQIFAERGSQPDRSVGALSGQNHRHGSE